ncbi:MAG TPA: hypothetical protein DCD96_08720 [Flavobacteriales bacterium]|nr:hypothetical protein [Flavobacteriales bacterium]HRE74014.1 tetratricopeptide repeat protein [Flavobacteriales bacterium]HRJ34858.1 tetratricopeptide repeat protein [Flavobacteriales bacterium]HRJ39766.1 tetratricopeptide repeat protein [Flavobacteriales bacterium]
MRKLDYCLLFVFVIISGNRAFCVPQTELDSMRAVNVKSLTDSLKARHEFLLGKKWEDTSSDSAVAAYKRSINYHHRSLVAFLEPHEMEELARVYLRLGLNYKNAGQIHDAKLEYEKALFLFEYLQSRVGVAECVNNIGLVYYQLGELGTTLNYLYRSLYLLESAGELKNSAYCYLNIASVQEEMGEDERALESYLACLALLEEINDPLGLSYVHNNLSYLYCKMKAFQQAIEHAARSYSYAEQNGDKRSMSYSLANMGTVYLDLGDHDRAIEYFEKGLQLREELGDAAGIVYAYDNIAEVYRDRGEFSKAIELGEKAYKKAVELGYPEIMSRTSKIMYMIYEKKGDPAKAFPFYKMHITMRDSLQNQKNRDNALRQEMLMNFGKRETEFKKEQEAQQLLHAEESKRQRLILSGVVVLLVIIALSAWMFYNRFKVSQQQKKEIERQKLLVDEKNREILDSINYAKRLQQAILPPVNDFSRLLGDAFVLYLPKDIVAGDFYFLETKEEEVLFAAADCTGHGVPGAMVSVVCANALNRVVKELGETDPGIVLDETARLVEATFSKNQGDVWDGMDISLCSWRKGDSILKWAGANNGIWIFRENEIIEVKPDKQPIGKFQGRKSFLSHQIEIRKNDIIVLFTDGFADQFGGPGGKKMKYKNVQKSISANLHLSMNELGEKLNQEFFQWKGDLEQIDDVTMIGIRI